MYQCTYCSTVFKEPVHVLACPKCGGPNPTKLPTEVFERVTTQYLFVDSRSGGYYRNPAPSLREQAYFTLGFKVLTGLTITAVLACVVALIYFWYFYNLGAPKDADPAYRNIIPTAMVSVTPYQSNNPWQDTYWLSSSEAASLRDQNQVVNLAYLIRGEARYANQGVVFNPEVWQKTKPLGVSSLTMDGTGLEVALGNYNYYLNIYQPFTIDGQTEKLYLVDEAGQFWTANLINITLVDLEAVKNSLPVVISPNPRLSPTY